MAEETAELARQLGQVPEDRMEELQALCDLAEQELEGRLKSGITRAACGAAFTMGAAWLGLAGLCAAGAADEVESFTAGSLTIHHRDGGGAESRSLSLRRQAEQVMRPYLRDDGFCFLGVQG